MTQPSALALRERFPALPRATDVLFRALADASKPHEELTVSEWADRYRKVSAESGSRYPGDWLTARVPYLRQVMDCLHPDHPARTVTMRTSAQVGKSEIIVNWLGFIVDRAPGSMLIVLPSLDEAVKFNRVKIQPTIDASPQIRHRVRPENSRDEAASTSAFKRFAGGFAQITTASSSKGLQMISVRYLAMDEVSEYPTDTDGRGSPIDQARARQKSFGDMAKEYASSTPGIVGECRVTAMYEAGDRRRCYVPCPHCRTYQVLDFANMHGPSETTRGRAAFACQSCGSLIDQADRPDMLATHRWVPTRVAEGEQPVPALIAPEAIEGLAVEPCTGRVRNWQPSFALWSAYSPFESWTDIWARWEAAKGDPVKLKTFTQQDLGEAYDPAVDAPDWEKLLAARTSWPRGTVPYPAAALTGFIDVQDDRVEWAVWGWGPGFRGWLVDAGIIAMPVDAPECWAAIDALVARDFPTSCGVRLAPIAWGMDTGFNTQIIYDRLAGRPAILACKGVPVSGKPPVKLTDGTLRDRFNRPIPGRKIRLGLIGTFDLKCSVYAGLKGLVAGADSAGQWAQNTLHLPDWVGEDYLRQLTAEVLFDPKTESRGNAKRALLHRPGDQREWRKRPGAANEAFDCAVGARALAWQEGAGQISPARWAELVALAHRQAEDAPPDLFTAPALDAPPPPPEPKLKAPPSAAEHPTGNGWFTGHDLNNWMTR